jgi:hypothetical protein
MYWMAPVNFNGGAPMEGLAYPSVVGVPTSVDAFLGIGPPLKSTDSMLEHSGDAVPAQCLMGDFLAQQPLPQVVAPIQCASMSSGPMTVEFGAVELQSDASWFKTPLRQSWADASDDDEDEDGGTELMVDGIAEQVAWSYSRTGISKSTLRRRRRQRFVARQPDVEPVSQWNDEEPQTVEAQADEILKQFQVGGESSRVVAARLRRLGFTSQASSRVVQLVLERANRADAVVLSKAMLRGHVREAMRSMFANYVVQKIVEVLPSELTSFIPEELVGVGNEVARHRFGCRIFCRLLEHGSLNEMHTKLLLEEVLEDAESLCAHAYGNYVIRHCLEFGFIEHQRRIVQALSNDLVGYARNQYGSRVIEAALQFCGQHEQESIIEELLADPSQFLSLAKGLSSRHVVKALLKTPGVHQQRATEILRAGRLHEAKYGRLVIEALREMP